MKTYGVFFITSGVLISFGENKHIKNKALVVHHQQKCCVILRKTINCW